MTFSIGAIRKHDKNGEKMHFDTSFVQNVRTFAFKKTDPSVIYLLLIIN